MQNFKQVEGRMVYYDVTRGIQNIFNTRLEIVQLAIEKGIF